MLTRWISNGGNDSLLEGFSDSDKDYVGTMEWLNEGANDLVRTKESCCDGDLERMIEGFLDGDKDCVGTME